MTAFDFLINLHAWCHFQSREGAKVGVASKSEIRRWFKNQAVQLNGERVAATDTVEFPITEFVLFPKGQRVTLR